MELRQLKYFLKAQELLSFTEAAHSLCISQSTLSQQIKQLEIELDIHLFDRKGRQISLTEAGRLFVPFAQQSVRTSEEGKLMIGDLKGLKRGSLRIGVAYGLRSFFLKVLLNFASEFQNIDIKIVYGPSHKLYEKLRFSAVDFIVAFHEGDENVHFSYQQLFTSSMVFVCSLSSSLSERAEISMEEISELPLIIATQDFGKNHIVHRSFAEMGLHPRFAIEVNDIQSAIELVSEGRWHSILVETSIVGTNLKSIPISNSSLQRNSKIISLKDVYESQSVKEFKRQLLASVGG